MRSSAKPFLKWAGGKTQLIPAINRALPDMARTRNFTYVEPFVGSGAVFFWMKSNFPNLKKSIINDVNADLINAYRVIAGNTKELVDVLTILEKEYHSFVDNDDARKEYYYEKRNLFNQKVVDLTMQAALLIFLNRTCFNGLFRVNSKNMFNVPMGSYKSPTICDADNLFAVCEALKGVEITCSDFADTLTHVDQKSFFYFDPPYKPLSATSSFNSYSVDEFNDEAQIRLREYCDELTNQGHVWLLSNSDVREKNHITSFFDDIYSKYHITRVKASRRINANPSKRGELNELLISNYQYEETYETAQL